MTFSGMDDFQKTCKEKLVEWYNESKHTDWGGNFRLVIGIEDVHVVWSCKTLRNYKALLSTNVNGDGVYAEYTYNGDKEELYEDVYEKVKNTCHK